MAMTTIPEDVIEGLMDVRETRETNMFDRRNVAIIAESLGYDETADWVRDEDNGEAYAAWICGK